MLAVVPLSIDAIRFEDQARDAMAAVDDEPNAAASALREGLAMWRGHPYSDVDGRAVFEPEIIRLGELRLSALEHQILDQDPALDLPTLHRSASARRPISSDLAGTTYRS